MLTKAEEALMNTPIFGARGCVGFRREVLRPEVAELILECVHPGNLGELPPSPDVIAFKAVQIGLVKSYTEAFRWERKGQFN